MKKGFDNTAETTGVEPGSYKNLRDIKKLFTTG